MSRSAIAVSRTVAGTRTASGNRQVVRDFGTCLKYNAVGNSISFSDSNSLDINDQITIIAWICPSTLGENGAGRIIDKTDGAAEGYGLSLQTAVNASLNFLPNGVGNSSSANVIKLRQWQHVAVTYDRTLGSNQISFFVNSVAAGNSTSTASMITNSRPLTIGNRASGGRTFNGLFDEVIIFNRALSSTEISNHYYKGTLSTTGLVLYTKFNEGSGTSAIDSSGTQANGTISGFTYSTNVFMKLRTAAP